MHFILYWAVTVKLCQKSCLGWGLWWPVKVSGEWRSVSGPEHVSPPRLRLFGWEESLWGGWMQACPPSPGSCVSLGILTWAVQHHPDLIQARYCALAEVWRCCGRKRRLFLPGRSKKPPGCIAAKSLCVVSGPFLVVGNCSSESHKVMKMWEKYGFHLVFWHCRDTSCIFNVSFRTYAAQLRGFTSPQNY